MVRTAASQTQPGYRSAGTMEMARTGSSASPSHTHPGYLYSTRWGMSAEGGTVPGYTMQKQQLQTRLRRIEGQVRGVARMIDQDKYCVDVVTQVAAIQAALDKVSLGLLDGHIRGCVREEIQSGGGDAKVDELLQVMDRVLRR